MITWDTSILPPITVDFEQDAPSRSGGQSVLGNEQVVVSGAGRWKATYTIKISTIRHRLTYRGWKAASNGRAGTWLIPTCSGFQTYAGSLVADIFDLRDIFVPPDIFIASHDAGYPISPTDAVATANATKGDRLISISMSDQTPPLPGLYFSIGSGSSKSLYLIASVNRTGTDAYQLAFWPGLRSNVTSGDYLDFSKPACRMRLANDTTGGMSLELLKFATVTLEFVEDFSA